MAIKKDMLVEKYIEALESGTIPWEKGWTTTRLHNPITGTTYTGINRIWLTFASYLKGYKDSRWFTFNEISNEKKFHPGEKWHLKKGAEGVEIKKDLKMKQPILKHCFMNCHMQQDMQID